MIPYEIEANIKFNRMFECAHCGRQALGETRHITLVVHTIASLSECFEHHVKTMSNDFPVNWASFPNNRFVCKECIHRGRN